MPKIVDHDMQKELIAKATWKIIQSEGLDNATVRKIALKAGVSSGALRHYFNSQAELLEFAMSMITQHIEQRFISMSAQMNTLTLSNAKKILLNFIPLDDERKLEMEVWLSLSVNAIHEPSLKAVVMETYQLMHTTIITLLEQLYAENLIKQNLNLPQEANRLQILIDGLSLHRMICPEEITIEQVNFILSQHFEQLSTHSK